MTRSTRYPGKQTVGKAGLLGPRTRAFDHVHAAVALVLGEPMDVPSRGRLERPLDQQPVDLFHAVPAELLAQPAWVLKFSR